MQQSTIDKIKSATKSYDDFKKDVVFIDIFPIVSNPEIYQLVIDAWVKRLEGVQFDKMFML